MLHHRVWTTSPLLGLRKLHRRISLSRPGPDRLSTTLSSIMGKKFSYLVKGSKRRLKTYAEEDDAGWICAFMWRSAALPNYEWKIALLIYPGAIWR
jgi:hypothetical protein